MDARKLLAVGLAALLVSAGVGAAATSAGTGATIAATDGSVDEYDADASYDDGTVTFAVTKNGSAASGLPVAVDGDSVGPTDATGSVAFDVNASETENVTVVVTGENVTGEFTYAVENDSLTLVEGGFESTADDAEEGENETGDNETGDSSGPQIGLPENASDNAEAVVGAISAYMNGETNASSLGEAVSAVAGNGDAGSPEDAGPDGDAGPPEDAGPDDDAGPPEDAGPDGDDDDSHEEDEDDSDNDEEDGDDGGAGPGNGNGNGNDR